MTKNQKIASVFGVVAFATSIFGYFYFTKKEAIKPDECLKGQTEIYQKYKNAVLLVKHTYCLQFTVKNSKPFNLDIDAYGLQEHTIYGTGFFVSQDGKIITNHHVAEPWLYDTENSYSLNYIKEHISQILPDSIPDNEIKKYLEANWQNENDEQESDFDEQATETTDSTVAVIGEEDTNSAAKSDVKMVSIEDVEIKPISKEISVALHNSIDTWFVCKAIKIANDSEVDVAVLQLNSQKTPKEVTNIIDLSTAIANDSSLKPGTKAILIGYPMGMTLANTRRGIKVQVYEGQINKESDGVSIQYNITSTHGASGSPVFNECGQLIAINYAGFDEAQGYNFGIVAKYAKELVN